MNIGKKWAQYLLALSLSLPTVAAAASPASSTAQLTRPVVVSPASAQRIGQMTPDAKPVWTRIVWIQEFGQWTGIKQLAGRQAASTDEIPSLSAFVDELKNA